MTLALEPQVATGWAADKEYYIAYHQDTKLVSGLYGSLVGFNLIEHAFMDGITTAYVGVITEEMYITIGEGITAPHALVFYENGELKIRKLIIDLGEGTFIDNKRSAIVAVDNNPVITIKCVDSNNNVWSDVTTVDLKNLAKLDFPISFNNGDSKNYKLSVPNNSQVTLKLEDQGRVTVRFKVAVPEVNALWLAVYPEFYGLDQAGLDKLSAWAAQNPV